MKIRSLKSNQTEVELNNGTTVFVSYQTPVAAFLPGQGFMRTNKKWSVTTSRHINSWIRDTAPMETVTLINQSELDGLLA